MAEPFDPALRGQYAGWLRDFGLDIRVAGWCDPIEAVALYTPLTEGFERGSVLDVGCNLGFLSDFLEARGIVTSETYDGIDCLPFLVEAARQRRPGWRFHAAYLLDWRVPADHVVACGVLNYGPVEYIAEALRHLWGLARKTLSLNTSDGSASAADNATMISDILEPILGVRPTWMTDIVRGYAPCQIRKTA